MNDHDIHRFASTLAEIAHALEHVDEVQARVGRVLELTATMVPYSRITLLDIEDSQHQIHTVPTAEPKSVAVLASSLLRTWRRIVDDTDHRCDELPAESLTLPVMGLDRINGLIRVEPPDQGVYDATHLRLLSVVAAQLGAYLTMTRLRAAQARHNAELATAIEFQQVLAAVVGHDLRSPLAVIMTVACMLRETTTDPNQLRALDRALSSAQRASRLISDLIDVTECRVQGAMPIRRLRTDARRIVDDVVEEARIAHPRCTITLDIQGNEVVFGQWDPHRLAEVLTNLINNAVHHGSSAGTVRVTMSYDSSMLQLSVHNTGDPIPDHLFPTIFDPFKRGSSARAAGKHGLGLGLYIVDQITRAHGGTITVLSTHELGTTFTLSLPRDAEVPPPRRLELSQTVMIVDDDPDVRIGIAALLEKRGFGVAEAADGQDAYEQLLRGLRPSAILLDLHMPRMDGQAFYERCAGDPALADIPIIIVSSDAANALKLSRTGAVLAKPVKGADLLRALDSIGEPEKS
ncbi:MAG: response regulator [Deltaproteobacteria bacterium]|nr:response regulator [Deltaproteobacteria bacterium]